MWLTPFFLLGLAGIALPIWLHRFARKTDQKHQFASSMFLEASVVRRNRRREVRYWLLLIARVLLVLCCWRWPSRNPSCAARCWWGRRARRCMPSCSIRPCQCARTAAGSARREQASTLIGAVKGADRAMLVAADYRIRVLQEAVFGNDAGRLRAALQGLEPGYSRLDYGAMVSGTAAWGTSPGREAGGALHHPTCSSPRARCASPTLRRHRACASSWWMWRRRRLPTCASPDCARIRAIPVRCGVGVDGDAAALASRALVIEVNGRQVDKHALKAGVALPLEERFALAELGPASIASPRDWNLPTTCRWTTPFTPCCGMWNPRCW